MLKIHKSKGVMSKDGITPWAAGTLHATSCEGWMSPYQYSMPALVYLIDGLLRGQYTEIELIDTNNDQLTISKDKRFKAWRNK